jgi:predicted HTH transcriptional regulator
MNLTRDHIVALMQGQKLKHLTEEGITTEDMMECTGLGEGAAHRRIKKLIADGVLVYAGRKSFKRIDGVMSKKPAYKLAPEPTLTRKSSKR